MFRKMSLQNKILFTFATVILLMMSSLLIFDSYSLRMAVKDTYVSQLKGIATAINGRYEESRSIQDVQQIFDYIKHKEPNILRLTLHVNQNSAYKVVSSTDRNLIGIPTSSTLNPTLYSSKTLISHIKRDQDQIPQVSLVAPLQEDGITIGAIEVVLNTSEDESLVQNRIQKTMLVGILISLLLLALLWFIIRKLLVLPLLSLREAAVTVQRGESYEEVQLNASHEINEVASAFNDMVYNLEDRYQKSIRDPLTGVYNSAYFKHKLTESMGRARESGHPMALLFCDVDNFKKLNDSEGHLFGDEVLKEIAKVILGNVRPTDTVCRYGGEEFVIIMPVAERETARYIAEQIRQMIAVQCNFSVLHPVTISIGLVIFPEDGDESTLVHLADKAMYLAKSLGKNRIVSVNEMDTSKNEGYERRSEDNQWLLHTIVSLARAVEVKDSYTHSHSEMVSRYAAAIASTMGLSDHQVQLISIAGLLHDVGKIGIPDSILNKEGRLDNAEYEVMKDHPVLGYNILAGVNDLKDILPYVLHHHERPDGKGYPNKLKIEQIPLGARIIAVADAFHSMVSARPYRKQPLSTDMALEELKQGSGSQFDPRVVETFFSIVEEIHHEGTDHTA
jgi:diguanylate cyclase (GGDEF)-like protein/putative nucleotidyltransferase with HDIG domain